MSGIKYLLDTNFILGILKSSPAVVAEVSKRKIFAAECAYSAITRMELLGYPGIALQHRPHRPSIQRPPRERRKALFAPRRHDRLDESHAHHPVGAAGRDLQPRRTKPRGGEL